MPRWKDLYVEWKARRAGRRGLNSSIHRATRDVTGPTGWAFSASFDKLDQHGDAYIKSFDQRVPPSIFVSERDRTRFNQPMPLAERCIENHPESARHLLDDSLRASDAEQPARLNSSRKPEPDPGPPTRPVRN